MTTKFDYTFEYEYCGDINKFINHRLYYGSDHNPPSNTEKLSSNEYKKTIPIDIKYVGKPLLQFLKLDNLIIEQFITINNDNILCTIEACEQYKKYLDFKEEYLCIVNNNQLKLKLRIWGDNKCPKIFKKIIENLYINKRKERLEHEIMVTQMVDEDDSIIQ